MIKYGRVKNYDQWYLKIGIFYFEYCKESFNQIGFTIEPVVKQYVNKQTKVKFKPAIFITIYLNFIGQFDFNINGENSY